MSFGVFGMANRAKAHAKNEIAKARANSARTAASGAQHTADTLEKRVNRLALVSMALWSLLAEKTQLTEKDLMERVEQLDMMDGQADGKLTENTVDCPKCGRPIASRVATCQFCGAERPKVTAFDAVL